MQCSLQVSGGAEAEMVPRPAIPLLRYGHQVPQRAQLSSPRDRWSVENLQWIVICLSHARIDHLLRFYLLPSRPHFAASSLARAANANASKW